MPQARGDPGRGCRRLQPARRGGRGAHARAATPAAQNDDYGADSGPSQGDPGGRAIRPIGESEAAVRYVRCTSTPAVHHRDQAPSEASRSWAFFAT
jgi:hypothetical protein